MRQPIPRSELLTRLDDPTLRQVYVSPGLAPLVADGFVPEYHVRLALYPRADAAAMAAELDRWAADADAEVGFAAGWPDAAELIAPAADGRWARVDVEPRATLLLRAIECVGRHADEIAVLDLGETSEPGFLAMLRRERLHGGPAMLGGTIERAFFSLVYGRPSADERELLVLAPGQLGAAPGEDVAAWEDEDCVVAPPDALAGLVLAGLAELVVCQRLALRQRPPPTPLAPALAAALRSGHELLAPRLCNLLPRAALERRQ
ncbi:MAG: hypothetical protein JNK56_31060 [Myxococcales bacterium]|nr:hypothetical protein [Myxococcales bacterium]